ncbi:MAG: winged helix-turn-helix domain-containing protein [Ilumatobacteraceae bacterium]|nr:winged helix-turn-helix transcriptional regulator [Ilumatobacter sp.]MCB0983101.1 winged helix-turn-helix transcriptional regulator [Ilumatobacter sp.]
MSDVQRGIHQLDYELAEEISADTPARLKALAEPYRMLLLDLVLERAMSVTELAARTSRPKGTVAHHVDVLADSGLLQVVRTRRRRAMEERFYGRTARTIVFPDSVHDGDLPFVADARRLIDMDAPASTPSMFTMRAVRIPDERADEFCRRLHALALEFSRQPRSGRREYAVLLALFPTNRPVAPKDEP